MSTTRAQWRAYTFLVVLRVLIAFSSRSIIHPDEHFQNPEIAAALVFDYSRSGGVPLKTWEWQGGEPCRSVAPLLISSGAAFSVVKAMVGDNPTAQTLFFAQRAAMLLISFVIDMSIHHISSSPLSLLLFASAPVTFTFLLRPFSNSLETVTLALAIFFTSRLLSFESQFMVPIGAVLAFGVWTRITFVAFAFPLVFAIVVRLSRGGNQRYPDIFTSLKRGSPAVISFFSSAYLLAILDTRYFRPQYTLFEIALHPSRLIITPLNLLKYNLSSENLAQHGIHPRWLHALVNLPMLYGVGLAIIFTCASDVLAGRNRGERVKDRKQVFSDRLLLASILVPLALLSIQPHQEPRFLLPLIVPLALLAPRASFLTSISSSQKRKRKAFWALWILHSLLFTIFFGYLHQGGLLSTLLKLDHELRDSRSTIFGSQIENVDLVFWKTFMPPRHLLLPLSDGQLRPISSTRSISIVDLGGVPRPELHTTLLSSVEKTTSRTFLISPSYLFNPSQTLLLSTSASSTTTNLCANAVSFQPDALGSFFADVHLDMDRLGEMVDSFTRRGMSGLEVGIWEVVEC
ncbi:hypothetical protein JCM3765_006628 [Sporobolomyces pararoseus]